MRMRTTIIAAMTMALLVSAIYTIDTDPTDAANHYLDIEIPYEGEINPYSRLFTDFSDDYTIFYLHITPKEGFKTASTGLSLVMTVNGEPHEIELINDPEPVFPVSYETVLTYASDIGSFDVPMSIKVVVTGFEEIPLVDNGTCGDGISYSLYSDGTLVISGTGYMYDYGAGEAPWYGYSDIITGISLKNRVYNIGDNAFYGCTSLNRVTMSSVADIGKDAFYGCTSLEAISLPNTLKTIDGNPFGGCTSLTSITVTNSNTAYRTVDGALYSKDLSTLVIFPTGKTSHDIDPSATSIASKAFLGCVSLNRLEIPSSIETIEEDSFVGMDLIDYDGTPMETGDLAGYMYEGDDGTLVRMIRAAECTVDENVTVLLIPYGKTFSDYDTISDVPGFHGWFEDSEMTVSFDPKTPVTENITLYSITEHIACDAVVENYVPPTCSMEGSCDIVTYCRVCNEVVESIPMTFPMERHTVVTDPEILPTCTETGLTEGSHCEVCGTIIIEQYEIPALGHSFRDAVIENYVDPTCTEEGSYDSVVYCSVCNHREVLEHVTLEKSPHTEVTDRGFPATCTESGLTDGIHCEICGTVLVEQTEIPALGHSPGEAVIENYIDSTCTEEGSYDSVTYCTVCNEKLSTETVVVETKPHTEVVDPMVPATCTEPGLSEGTHCEVCGTVLVEQTEIPALGHSPGEAVIENYVDSTCTEEGSYDSVIYCIVCNEKLSTEPVTVEMKPHTEIVDPMVPATCTEPGITEGSHCEICGTVIIEQAEIPALGHSPGEAVIENYVDSTCTKEGNYDLVTYCTTCGDLLSTEIVSVDLKPHTETIDLGFPATCTEPGLSDGSHCKICGTILVEQAEIPALGHDYIFHEGKEPTSTEHGWNAYRTCSRCDYNEYAEIPSTGTAIVTYDIDGYLLPTITVADSILSPLPMIPVKASADGISYTFVGWEGYTAGMRTYDGLVLKAMFKADNVCTVTIVYNDGTIETVEVQKGSVMDEPVRVPKYFKDEEMTKAWSPTTKVYNDLTVYALKVRFGTAGNNVTWNLDYSTGTLTISGEGPTYNWKSTSTPWYAYRNYISNIVVEEGITHLGTYAFYKYSMTEVILPDSLVKIGKYAIVGYALEHLVVGSGLESIGTRGIYGVALYENGEPVKITASNLKGKEYFGTDGELDMVAVHGTLGDIVWNLAMDTGSFVLSGTGESPSFEKSSDAPWYDYRNRIESVTVSEGVTSVGSFSFYGCSNLTSVVFPDSLMTLAKYAIKDCPNISHVEFGTGLVNYSALSLGHLLYNSSGTNKITSVSKIAGGTFELVSGKLVKI